MRGGESGPLPVALQPTEVEPAPAAVPPAATGPTAEGVYDDRRVPEPRVARVADDTGRPTGALITTIAGGVLLIGGAALLVAGLGDAANVEDADAGTPWSDVSGANDRAPLLTGLGIRHARGRHGARRRRADLVERERRRAARRWPGAAPARRRARELLMRGLLVLCYDRRTLGDERRSVLQSVWNFRDVGGQIGAGGRALRRGALYRSSRLSEVSDGDRETLARLGISTVCDLRREEERVRRPSRLDFADGLDVVLAPAVTPSTGAIRGLLRAGEKRVEPYRRLFVEAYRELARDNHAAWRAVMGALLRAEGATVVHCDAGQDRTGAAVAIVLCALGVERDAVMADYGLTASYGPPPDVAQMYASMRAAGLDAPEPAALIEILAPAPILLETFFETVEQDHGSMDDYLRDAIGLGERDVEALRARMLV